MTEDPSRGDTFSVAPQLTPESEALLAQLRAWAKGTGDIWWAEHEAISRAHVAAIEAAARAPLEAEVEREKTWRYGAEDELHHARNRLNDALAEVERLTRERDEAQMEYADSLIEVERLRAALEMARGTAMTMLRAERVCEKSHRDGERNAHVHEEVVHEWAMALTPFARAALTPPAAPEKGS